jgi:hypothetical protein
VAPVHCRPVRVIAQFLADCRALGQNPLVPTLGLDWRLRPAGFEALRELQPQ